MRRWVPEEAVGVECEGQFAQLMTRSCKRRWCGESRGRDPDRVNQCEYWDSKSIVKPTRSAGGGENARKAGSAMVGAVVAGVAGG